MARHDQNLYRALIEQEGEVAVGGVDGVEVTPRSSNEVPSANAAPRP